MATKAISWGEGTSDKINLSFTGAVGSSQMTVASDPNVSATQRVKKIELTDENGVLLGTLIVTQKPRARSYSVSYSTAYK